MVYVLVSIVRAGPVDLFGNLSVSNNYIVDKNKTKVQLRGMSLFWSQHGHRYWNESVVKWLLDDWKIDIIRAPMGVDSAYLDYPDVHKGYVELVVDAAIKHGVYVIIDWHSHYAQNNTAKAKTFFGQMADKYGDTPNVIYEIYNEPMNIGWDQIKTYANAVIAVIRARDPDNLIVVGTPNWSQDVDQAANSPITGTNIVYAFHFYAASHSGLYDKAKNAAAKIPIMVTEWGTCEYTGSGRFDANESNRWLGMMKDNKISWCNWSIMYKNETSAALLAGTSSLGGWTTSQLSESGNFVRNHLRANTLAEIPASPVQKSAMYVRDCGGEIHILLHEGHGAGLPKLFNLQGRNIIPAALVEPGHFSVRKEALGMGIWIIRAGDESSKLIINE